MHTLIKKIDASRLAPAILNRLPSLAIEVDALADGLGEVSLSNGAAATLKLPHHSHLRPGEVLLDERGFMVLLVGKAQPALVLHHNSPTRLSQLALSLAAQQRVVVVNDGGVCVAFDAQLATWANAQGFSTSEQTMALTPQHYALPVAPDCGHAHGHTHAHHHDDNHSHAHNHQHH